MKTIAKNEFLQKHRRNYFKPYEDLTENIISELAIQENSAKIDIYRCIAKGLEEFSKNTRNSEDRITVLEMRWSGMTHLEIGQVIGRSEQAARQFYSECKTKVMPYIEHCNS